MSKAKKTARKTARKTTKAGRISAAAAKAERIVSGPMGERFQLSKKDAAGRVTLFDRVGGGRAVVPANMASFARRIVGELFAAAARGAPAAKGSAAAAPAAKAKAPAAKKAAPPAAKAPAKAPAAKKAAPPAAKAPAKPPVAAKAPAKVATKPAPAKPPVAAKAPAKAPAKAAAKPAPEKPAVVAKAPATVPAKAPAKPAAKVPAKTAAKAPAAPAAPAAAPVRPTVAKKAAPKKAVAKKAVAKKAPVAKTAPTAAPAAPAPAEEARRGPGRPSNAELSGQPIERPVQVANKLPDQIREYKPHYESRKGQTPPASLDRRFFEEERKWGYDVTIGGKKVGRLAFDHDKVWTLDPSDAKLVERDVKPTVHANPISAFVRVTNGWRRALSGESDAAVPPAAPAPAVETAA